MKNKGVHIQKPCFCPREKQLVVPVSTRDGIDQSWAVPTGCDGSTGSLGGVQKGSTEELPNQKKKQKRHIEILKWKEEENSQEFLLVFLLSWTIWILKYIPGT